jgi:hypothetical protein
MKLPKIKPVKLNAAEVSLTRGQVNAVRSAFKAGITPSRIARGDERGYADLNDMGNRYIGTTAIYPEVPDAMMRNAVELI